VRDVVRGQSTFRPVGRDAGDRRVRVRAALGEVIVQGLVLIAFSRLHAAGGKDAAAAAAHARSIRSAERWLHVDAELPRNRWLTAHERFITPAMSGWWERAFSRRGP